MKVIGIIDKESPIPYYYQLQQLLRDQISNGKLKSGDSLPSEAEFCSTFKVSRTVVRQALNKLQQDGLIYKEKAKGAFVAKSKLQEKFVQRTYGFYEEMKKKGFDVESKILNCELIVPTVKIRNLLEIQEKQKAVRISRLRSINREIIMLTTCYIRSDICPGLEKEDLTDRSLYQLLKNKYKLKILHGYRTLEAITASKYEADLLKVSKGAPLIYIESISYCEDDIPFEYFEAWHRGDRCKFGIEIIPEKTGKNRTHIDKQTTAFWLKVPSDKLKISDKKDGGN